MVIKFEDLSWSLKVLVTLGWIFVIFAGIAFIIGYIGGLLA